MHHGFRTAGFPIYHTREGHRPDLSTLWATEVYRSGNNDRGLRIGNVGPRGRLLVRGESGHDVIPDLYPSEDEPIIDTPGEGTFINTEFELLLYVRGIRNLVVAGVTIEECFPSTIRQAAERGFDCLLLTDGIATSNSAQQTRLVETVKAEGVIYGSTGNVQDVLNMLGSLSSSEISPKAPSTETAVVRMHRPATHLMRPVRPWV